MRKVVCMVMVGSFFVLGAIDMIQGNYKTGTVAVLLGIVQAIIFF